MGVFSLSQMTAYPCSLTINFGYKVFVASVFKGNWPLGLGDLLPKKFASDRNCDWYRQWGPTEWWSKVGRSNYHSAPKRRARTARQTSGASAARSDVYARDQGKWHELHRGKSIEATTGGVNGQQPSFLQRITYAGLPFGLQHVV